MRDAAMVEDDTGPLRLEGLVVEVPRGLLAVAADPVALAPGRKHLCLRHPEADAAERLTGEEDAGARRGVGEGRERERDAERRG
jgi:hypothetical protein